MELAVSHNTTAVTCDSRRLLLLLPLLSPASPILRGLPAVGESDAGAALSIPRDRDDLREVVRGHVDGRPDHRVDVLDQRAPRMIGLAAGLPLSVPAPLGRRESPIRSRLCTGPWSFATTRSRTS